MPSLAHPKLLEIRLPIRVDKLTEIMRFRGVPVYVHWSVWLVALFILSNVIRHPMVSLLAIASYFGVLLLHETGHLISAKRMRCDVHEIRLYPIFGITEFQTPWSKLDHCIIAWGGVIAQAMVAVPIIVAVTIFGYSRFEPVNAAFAIFGFFSLAVAFFNLLPIRPLDGSIAWAIIPEWFKRIRERRGGFRSSKY